MIRIPRDAYNAGLEAIHRYRRETNVKEYTLEGEYSAFARAYEVVCRNKLMKLNETKLNEIMSTFRQAMKNSNNDLRVSLFSAVEVARRYWGIDDRIND